MDREDYLYVAAIILVGLGVGLFHVGAGLASAGAMVALPPVIWMFRRGGTPPKDRP